MAAPASGEIRDAINGFRLSYLRWISDTAPGLVVLAIALVLFREQAVAFAQGMELFVALVALLLATPLGLLLNGMTWFFLGRVVERLEAWFVKHPRLFFTRPTYRSHHVAATLRYFGGREWVALTRWMEAFLLLHHPRAIEPFDHVRGAHRIARMMAFVIAWLAILLPLGLRLPAPWVDPADGWTWVAWTAAVVGPLAGAFILLCLSALLFFYYMSGLLLKAWILARTGASPDPRDHLPPP